MLIFVLSLEDKLVRKEIKNESYNNDDLFKKTYKKIVKKDFRVGIIGLGYVGLPLALGFCAKGLKLLGLTPILKSLIPLKM